MTEHCTAAELARRVAFYLRAVAEAAAALAEPDPDLTAERIVMGAHYAAPPTSHAPPPAGQGAADGW